MIEHVLQTQKEEKFLKSKKMYVYTPYSRVQAVEDRLKVIFEDELKSKGSILIGYNPSLISKLAKY